MAHSKQFRLSGRIAIRETGEPIAGVTVSAMDKDHFFDDRLGSAVTDRDGRYEIVYSESDFRDLFERRPDVYLVLCAPNGKEILSSKDSVVMNAEADERIDIDLSIARLMPGAAAAALDEASIDAVTSGMSLAEATRALEEACANQPDIDRYAEWPLSDELKAVDTAIQAGAAESVLANHPDVLGGGLGIRERNGEMVEGDYVLTLFVKRKVPASELAATACIPRSVTVDGREIETDVVELGTPRKLQSPLCDRRGLARNGGPADDVPIQGGIEIGGLGGTTFGTLAGAFQRMGGGNLWISNYHIFEAGLLASEDPAIQPQVVPPIPPYNVVGNVDSFVPFLVVPTAVGPAFSGSPPVTIAMLTIAAVFMGLRLDHLDLVWGRVDVQAIGPGHPGEPNVEVGLQCAGGAIRGEMFAYPGQPVRKSGARTSVTHGHTLVPSGFLTSGALALLGFPVFFAGSTVYGLTFHRLRSDDGDSGSKIVDELTDRATALLWGEAGGITLGDTAANVFAWSGGRA